MRVLMLSLDRALLDQAKTGDTLKRFIEYKKSCEKLIVIVPSTVSKVKQEFKGVNILAAKGVNNLTSYIRLLLMAKGIVEDKAIQLMVTNNPVLGALAIVARSITKANTKVQINSFGSEVLSDHWLKERAINRLYRLVQIWALKKADSIRVDNHLEKKLLSRQLDIPKKKIWAIPISPSPESQEAFLNAQRSESLREKILDKEKYLLLSVGTLGKAKDFPTLIQAAKHVSQKLPNTKFALVGSGPEEERINEEIRKQSLEGKLELFGSIPYGELPALYASSDLFVLSSTHEGFPRVLMEAALAGLPIVSTKVFGAQEIIKNGESGKLVSIKNPLKMSEAIVELLRDQELSKEYARKAKERAMEVLEFDRCLNELMDSWRTTIGKL